MLLLLTILLLPVGGYLETVTRFTNINCEVLDKSLMDFHKCNLKVLGRGIVGMNIHMYAYNVSITNVKLNMSLWRKYNGYKPFLFNVTHDFCKLMANMASGKLTFEKIVMRSLAEKSNLNHSCPFDNNIIIRNMVFKEDYLKFMPLPSAEYQYQAMIAFNNIWASRIKVQILRSEDLMINK